MYKRVYLSWDLRHSHRDDGQEALSTDQQGRQIGAQLHFLFPHSLRKFLFLPCTQSPAGEDKGRRHHEWGPFRRQAWGPRRTRGSAEHPVHPPPGPWEPTTLWDARTKVLGELGTFLTGSSGFTPRDGTHPSTGCECVVFSVSHTLCCFLMMIFHQLDILWIHCK